MVSVACSIFPTGLTGTMTIEKNLLKLGLRVKIDIVLTV